jgi:hypothetical protein
MKIQIYDANLQYQLAASVFHNTKYNIPLIQSCHKF